MKAAQPFEWERIPFVLEASNNERFNILVENICFKRVGIIV